MEGFVRSGHAVDLALLVLLAEAVWIAWSLRDRGRFGRIALGLLPGACLFLALRAALTGAAWHWILLWVALSLPAHLADLAVRIRR